MKPARVELSTLIPGNIRILPDPPEVKKRLGQSLKKGQKVPILISGRRIVDGHRRVAAALDAGMTHLDAIDVGDATEDEIRDLQITHGMHSEALPDYDRALALKVHLDRGASNKQIAEEFDFDPSVVTKLLSLWNCIKPAQDAAREGKIGPRKWYAISKSPNQAATLDIYLNGGKAEDGETKRKTNANTMKAKAIPIVMGNLQVVFKGEVTLDGAIEAAKKAARDMEDARKEGHDAQTYAALMKSRNKGRAS